MAVRGRIAADQIEHLDRRQYRTEHAGNTGKVGRTLPVRPVGPLVVPRVAFLAAEGRAAELLADGRVERMVADGFKSLAGLL